MEIEPNDSTSQATPAALRDTVSGVINPAFDVDYFALDVPANTSLDLDVDANQVGSTLDPVMALIAPDGQTVLRVNDDYDGMDSRIIYTVTTAGRYIVGIADYNGTGSLQHTYVIKLQVLVPGPGDPAVRVRARLSHRPRCVGDGGPLHGRRRFGAHPADLPCRHGDGAGAAARRDDRPGDRRRRGPSGDGL